MTSEAEADYLFVYGTLMRRARSAMGAAMRAQLTRASIFIGLAHLPGRLVDLGAYPGFIDAEDLGALVHGEVVRLIQPAEILAQLDAYEGLSDPPSAQDEYARMRRRVNLASGHALMAWIYVYQGPLDRSRPIAEGQWDG
jgi:gamma-glutamylcyclotransferase (GGCT)/AIG2-like uncharacterized protein YtfP